MVKLEIDRAPQSCHNVPVISIVDHLQTKRGNYSGQVIINN